VTSVDTVGVLPEVTNEVGALVFNSNLKLSRIMSEVGLSVEGEDVDGENEDGPVVVVAAVGENVGERLALSFKVGR